MTLGQELKRIVKGEVRVDSKTLTTYSRDASLFEVKPRVVVYPKSADDIKKLILFAQAHKDRGLSLTVRSGGTDMTGGPLSESIILDVTRYFNKIKKIYRSSAIVQPGVYYKDFEKETLKKNLLLPSFPASREICTVGGMVANNAGGEKSLSYGKTDHYVAQLKVILSDGKEYTVKPLTIDELEKKIAQNTFEGTMYKQLFKLLDRNQEFIREAKPNVSKNSAGYALWDVWNKKNFDLTKLFIGSQGTLGIITEITFTLIKPKKHSRILVMLLKEKDITKLAKITTSVLKYAPESFESYDDATLKVALRYFPEFVKQMRTNLLSLAWQFLPEFWLVLTGGLPKLVLLAEFTGDSEAETFQRCQTAQESLKQFTIKSHITKNPQENKKYHTIRRESFNLLRKRLNNKQAVAFIDDIIVSPENLPTFLPQLKTILDRYNLEYTMAGHTGNANFHILPLLDMSKPESAKIITELSEKVYTLVLKYGGSITAEHNDGLIRSFYLKKMYGTKMYKLFEQVKTILDPNSIFNPGKKIGASQEYSMKHLIKR